MTLELDIEKCITLVNKRQTSVDDLCKFLFEVVENYQMVRENFYMEQLKENPERFKHTEIDQYVEEMAKKIEKDVVKFVPSYVDTSIDKVLDALNQKKFKTKKGPTNLLVLLTTLKETYEEKK